MDARAAVVGTLVTWRVSHLLVEEDGPGQSLVHLRSAVDRTPLHGLLGCFGCASVWVGVGAAAALGQRRVLDGLALSGAAFLVQRVVAVLEVHAGPGAWLDEPEVESPLVTVTP